MQEKTKKQFARCLQIEILMILKGYIWCQITKSFSFELFSYLKAVFESFAHQIQSDWINAGIQGGHVDANIIQYQ